MNQFIDVTKLDINEQRELLLLIAKADYKVGYTKGFKDKEEHLIISFGKDVEE